MGPGTVVELLLPPALRDPSDPGARRARFLAATLLCSAAAAAGVLAYRVTEPTMAHLSALGVWAGVAIVSICAVWLRRTGNVDGVATLLLAGTAIYIPLDAAAIGGLAGNALAAMVAIPILGAFLLTPERAAGLAGLVAVGIVADGAAAHRAPQAPPELTLLGRITDIGTSLALLAVMTLLAVLYERERGALYQRVREREARYAAAIAADHAGIFEWRGAYGFVMVSARLRQMIGADPLVEQVGLAGRERLMAALATLRGGQRATLELERSRKDAPSEWFRIDLLGTGEPGAPAAVGIVRDVTEAHRAAQLKDEFVAVVSHELRTPLTSVHGAIALLRHHAEGGDGTASTDDEHRLLTIAHQSSRRLLALIDDLLDVQRLAAGALTLELRPHPLHDSVVAALTAMEPVATAAHTNLRLEGATEAVVNVDVRRLGQVLTNLIDNACKWTRPGTEVRIRVEAGEGDRVRVTITDAGPGVPESFRAHLFQRFSQAGAVSRTRGGTGLGLYIARGFIERMGGTIGYHAEAKGSSFWIELPRAG